MVRWTAPAAGSYRILAKWIDLDPFGGNGASAHVTINGTEVFGRKVPADPNGPARFVGQEWENGGNAAMPAETFRLNAGDVVDFLVGSRGDFTFDSTTFNALISKVATVTVPGAQPESLTFEGANHRPAGGSGIRPPDPERPAFDRWGVRERRHHGAL